MQEILKGFVEKPYDHSILSDLANELVDTDTAQLSKRIIFDRSYDLTPWGKEIRDMVYEDIIKPVIEEQKAYKKIFGNGEKYGEQKLPEETSTD